ncbi:SWIB/MDM2 domain-containing protein [Patescibacteria group bacterium]|nr:SWIB/MDM2 domain-containing protein [Patescibacteria group bacterium]MBU1895823.1 SWIB/MDM2 domain-containing protein [Patescibacteria group bacterium]
MVRKANPALMKPLKLSDELEAVIGKGPLPRGQVVKKLWEYIKKHDLQNPENKRNIIADEKLLPLFGGKKEVTMFEMTKLVSPHMTSTD